MPSKTRRLRSKKSRVAPKQYRSLLIEPLEGRLLLTAIPPIIVDTASDAKSHVGISLRDAITQANADAKAGTSDTIQFDPSLNGATITLAQGELELGLGGAGSGLITIDGGNQISISGNNASRVFQVDTNVNAELEGLTIEGGSVTDDQSDNGNDGAGLLNFGSLTVMSCTITGNTADGSGGGIDNAGALTIGGTTVISYNTAGDGGGIYNTGTTLTVTGTTIANNSASDEGGAVYDEGDDDTLTFTDCVISDNSAEYSIIGGFFDGNVTLDGCTITGNMGIYDNFSPDIVGGFSTLTVMDSTISGNTGTGIENVDATLLVVSSTISDNTQGGIINLGDGTATIESSTISGNSYDDGGGIDNEGNLTLLNSTVSGNTASYEGGGIYNAAGATLTVSSSTISGNMIPGDYGDGGGIYEFDYYGSAVTLLNTIVAANTASADPDISSYGAGISGSNNLIGDGTGITALANGINGNQVGTDANPIVPLLGTLADNGGTTKTMALEPGSPAIGQGGPLTALTGTGGIGPTETTIAVADAAAIASTPGNVVIEIDAEQLLVTDVNLAKNTLTVTRGYNHTTAASHNAAASVFLPTDQIGQPRPATPDIGAFQSQFLTPNVSSATTIENVQTKTGLVVTPSTVGGDNVESFQITDITGGTLFFQNGDTLVQIVDLGFITTDEGLEGLRFTPDSDSTSPGSFLVQQSTTTDGAGLEGPLATAQITVLSPLHAAGVTTAQAQGNAQTTSGLVITPNDADLGLVVSFQITDIQGGTLFKADGTHAIGDTDFITVAEGAAGLKFTPDANSTDSGSFLVQESFTSDGTGLGGPTSTATISRLIVWTGNGDGKSWSQPANWSGVVPGVNNDVKISTANQQTIVYDVSAGNTSLHNLTLGPGVTLSIAGGSLTVDGSFTIGGIVPVAGSVMLTSGSLVAGLGTAAFASVTFNVADDVTASISAGTFTGLTTLNVGQNATLSIEGTETISGTLTGSGSGTVEIDPSTMSLGFGGLTVNFGGSMLQWTGGEIDCGNGDLTNLGTLNLSGNNTKDFYNDGTLDNFGTIVQTGTGNLELGTEGVYLATLMNEAGASYLIEGNSGLDERSNSGTAPGQISINNAGIIRKTAGTGVSSLDPLGSINNTGTIEADSGTILLNPVLGVAQISGSTLTGGTWDAFNGASIQFPKSITSSAANISLQGAGAAIVGISGLSSNRGQFSLSGGATFTTTGNFANSGTLTLGTTSVLTVKGNFSQTATGVLDDQIGGAPASGLLGKITASGTAALGGVFNLSLVNGFTPAVGQTFPVLAFASATGNFASLGGLKSLLSETLAPTSLSLSASNAADLAVSSVTAPPTALAGQQVTVAWQVNDASSQAASGAWQDSVYLSATPTITSSSMLLGTTLHTTGLGAGNSYNASLTVNLPATLPGNYYVLVQADSLYQSPDSNRTNNTLAAAGQIAVSLPSLTLGTPLAGTFTAAGQNQYYQVVVPTGGGSLVVALASAAGSGATALYVSQGTLPTPYSYQFSVNVANQPNQTLTIPQAAGTLTYYILAQSIAGAAATAGFTLTAAQTNGLEVSRISTQAGGNSGKVTIEIDGTNFLSSATASLQLAATTLEATAIDFVSSSQLFATFNLAGAAVGGYTLSVQQDVQTATAPGTFQVVAAPAASLTISLSVPSAIRPGHAGTVVISYTNTSDNDIVAPLLEITSTNTSVSFSTPDDPNDYVQSAQLLAVAPAGPAGIVRPGQSGQLSLSILSNDTNDGDSIPIQVSQLVAGQAIDWASQQASLRPSNISLPAWNVIFGNLLTMIGSSTDSFDAALASSATYLSGIGETTAQTSDVGRLWSFMLAQAGAALPASTLASSVDAALAAPGGVSLSLDRTFASTIASRDTLGMFGVGWATSWQTSLSTDSSGNVTIASDSGLSTSFFVHQTNGNYLDTDGEAGTLTLVGNVYTFTDTSQDQYVFLPSGLLSYIQDTNGNRIMLGYNGQQQITSLTYSNPADAAEPSEQLTLSYNPQGFVSQEADGTGNTWTYAYDAAGHLLSVTAPGNLTTSYTYNNSGNPEVENALLSITNPDGSQENFSYDSQGRLAGVSANGGADAVTFTYNGGEITASDALGQQTIAYLNDAGQAVKTIDPLGNVTYATVDNNGEVVSAVGPGGQSGSVSYNSVGDPVSASDPLGHATAATYNSTFDALTSLTDPLGNTQSYAYNSQNGNLQTITYADGSQQKYAYDALGDVTEFVNQLGQAIQYSYNTQGLLVGEAFSDGTQATFSYDAHQNLASMTDPTGTTTFSYNAASQLTGVAYPDGSFLAYTYNAAGQRTQMTDQTGFTVNYGYDALGRLAQLTDAASNLIVQYSYDAAGQLASETFGNSTQTTYSYDADGDVTDIVNLAPGGAVQSSYAYTYNAQSLPVTMTTQAGTFTYDYDADGQLTSVLTPTGEQITYQYDANGNRIAVVDGGTTTAYTTNNLNQYTQVGGTTYQYDANGDLISSTDSSGTTTYTYNAFGQVTSVVSPSGTSTYQYDGLGFLASETVNGQVTNNLIDPTGLGNVVAQTNGSGGVLGQYTYGLGLVSQVNALGTSAYYSFDLTGNTMQLTGTGGAVLNTYSYLPFGQVLSSTGTTSNPFTYVGQYGVMDAGNGLYFMRNRFYDSSTGRFVSPDPLGAAGSGTNLYFYAGNTPLGAVDPTGESWNVSGGFKIFDVTVGWNSNTGDLYFGVGGSVSTPFYVFRNVGGGTASAGVGEVSGSLSRDQPPPSGGWYGNLTYSSWSDGGESLSLNNGQRQAVEGYGVSLSGGYGITIKLIDAEDQTVEGEYKWERWHAASLQNGGRSYMPSEPEDPQPDNLSTTKKVTKTAPIVDAHDPNALIGPAGYGAQAFIQPTSTNLPYTVEFENDGSVPAQDVTVTEQLDANLDWSTFQLGSFGFGPVNVTIPAGLTQYQTTVNYQNQDGSALNVLVALNFNVATGLLTTTFTSLDPSTGQAPSGVFDGFLPTDDSTHVGEGFVQYTVQPTAGLTTGDTIDQQAAVVFDTNQPIPTNTVINTVDSGAPTSSVAALPGQSPGTFTVNWSGTDDAGGSGIATYDVYVSVNSGPFTLWQSQTTHTSAAYAGISGNTYGFYSVATDNVGNVQPSPGAAQATTTATSGFSQNGTTLTVTGTSGDDSFLVAFSPDDSQVSVTFDGTTQTYATSSVQSLVIDGVSGNDSLLVGIQHLVPETSTLSASTLSLTSPTFAITSSNTPYITVDGKLGDNATLTDAPGANTLIITSTSEEFVGTGFSLKAVGEGHMNGYSNDSDSVQVQAAGGGTFVAIPGSGFLADTNQSVYNPVSMRLGQRYFYFHTATVNDASHALTAAITGNGGSTFKDTLSTGTMTTRTSWLQVTNFALMDDYAAGAGDTIELDTTGHEEFFGIGPNAYITGSGMTNGPAAWAIGFRQVNAVSTGRNDVAVLQSAGGNNSLTAAGKVATLATGNSTISVNGFARVTAYESTGLGIEQRIGSLDFALSTVGHWRYLPG